MYLVPFVADSVRTRAAAADPLQKRSGFNSGSEAELCRTGLFGSGLGLKLTKISGLIWAWDILFVLGAQKGNQTNLATLLNFSGLT